MDTTDRHNPFVEFTGGARVYIYDYIREEGDTGAGLRELHQAIAAEGTRLAAAVWQGTFTGGDPSNIEIWRKCDCGDDRRVGSVNLNQALQQGIFERHNARRKALGAVEVTVKQLQVTFGNTIADHVLSNMLGPSPIGLLQLLVDALSESAERQQNAAGTIGRGHYREN